MHDEFCAVDMSQYLFNDQLLVLNDIFLLKIIEDIIDLDSKSLLSRRYEMVSSTVLEQMKAAGFKKNKITSITTITIIIISKFLFCFDLAL